MIRKEPEQCPECSSKEISYEGSATALDRDDNGQDFVIDESEWHCGECDEIFYYRARYELGNFISEHIYT